MLLGFAFRADLSVLRRLCGDDLGARTLVDLQQLGRVPGEVNTPSLKRVCARALHRRLDKTQQCSDWGRRPLEREQLAYAALDAHILLEIHDALAQPTERAAG